MPTHPPHTRVGVTFLDAKVSGVSHGGGCSAVKLADGREVGAGAGVVMVVGGRLGDGGQGEGGWGRLWGMGGMWRRAVAAVGRAGGGGCGVWGGLGARR